MVGTSAQILSQGSVSRLALSGCQLYQLTLWVHILTLPIPEED